MTIAIPASEDLARPRALADRHGNPTEHGLLGLIEDPTADATASPSGRRERLDLPTRDEAAAMIAVAAAN